MVLIQFNVSIILSNYFFPRVQQYTLKDVLTAGYLIEEWKPELITELLSYFRPDNMRYE